MIMPARWFTGAGKGLEKFAEEMLADHRLRSLIDYTDSKSCFPTVEIAGGLCIFLWDYNKTNLTCTVINRMVHGESKMSRVLAEFKPYLRFNDSLSIIRKIKSFSSIYYDTRVSRQKPFGLRTYITPEEDGDLQLFYNGGIGPYPSSKVEAGIEWIPKWKLITSYLVPGGAETDKNGQRKILAKLEVLPPQTICTETYLVVDTFDTEAEARNCQSYMKTRFARFLIAQLATTQHLSRSTFALVPTVDCKEVWTDDRLKEKYGLTDAEFAFIERTIRPMD